MTWSTLFISPLILTDLDFGDDLMKKFLLLEWISDVSWSLEICINFIKASKKHRDFKSVSLNYITGFFFLDIVATIPPMILKEKNKKVNLLKLIRLFHIKDALKPFHFLVARFSSSRKSAKNAYWLISLIISAVLFAHLAACFWINIGLLYEDGPWISFIHNQRTNTDATDHEYWIEYSWD